MSTAGKIIERGGGSNSKTKAIAVTAPASLTTPTGVSEVSFHVPAGETNGVRVRINATSSNYITVGPGEWTPNFPIKGATLDVAPDGGSSRLECVFQG